MIDFEDVVVRILMVVGLITVFLALFILCWLIGGGIFHWWSLQV